MEIVRQLLIATSSGDFSDMEAACDPSIEWDMSGVADWVEQQVYRGPQVWKFLEDWRQSWEGWNFEVEEVLGAGANVFAGIHERAKGADTGVSVDQHRYLVSTLRDKTIVLIRMFSDRQEALKAAGLAE